MRLDIIVFEIKMILNPCFIENIRALSEKACYLGLRNTGSIKAVRSYLPANLHSKIRFQPCMTTYLSELYKKEINFDGSKQNFIAVNAAFDRSYLRFGNKIGQVLSDLALVLKDLSKIIPIKFYSHMASDESLLPFLDSFKVNYEVIRLNGVNPKEIIEAYIKPKLVIGMRGHAQMIPFGCKTPILSIITHDKMQWFLDDIGRPEWGVEALDANFKHILKEKSLLALDDIENRIDFIERKQREFFEISIKNVHEAFTYMKVN